MNSALSKQIEKIWEKPSVHTYFNAISTIKKNHSLKELVIETAMQASVRGGSHSLVGLYEAWQLQPFFFSRNRLLPLVQMIWFCMAESKEEPVDIQALVGTPPETKDLTLDQFQKMFHEKKFKESYRLLVFLLRNEHDRTPIYLFLLNEAIKDETEFGFKFNLLVQTWKFCDSIEWKDYHYFWLPVVYELVHRRAQHEASLHVDEFLKNFQLPRVTPSGRCSPFRSFARKGEDRTVAGPAAPENPFYNDFKNSIWNDEKSVTLEKLVSWQKNTSLEDLLEALKLVCSETVYMTSIKNWSAALSSSHFVQCVADSLEAISDEQKVKAVWMAALLVKKLSILCKPLTAPPVSPLQTIDEQNNALFFLEWGIKKGKCDRALGALEFLMSQNKIEKNPIVQELLAFLSGMNTYSVFSGNELQFAHSVLKNYKNASYDLKNIYIKSLVKLLSESPKELTIHNAVTNTQQIHVGYYTSGGEFSF